MQPSSDSSRRNSSSLSPTTPSPAASSFSSASRRACVTFSRSAALTVPMRRETLRERTLLRSARSTNRDWNCYCRWILDVQQLSWMSYGAVSFPIKRNSFHPTYAQLCGPYPCSINGRLPLRTHVLNERVRCISRICHGCPTAANQLPLPGSAMTLLVCVLLTASHRTKRQH